MPTVFYTTGPLDNLAPAATKTAAVQLRMLNNDTTETAFVAVNVYDASAGLAAKKLLTSFPLFVPPISEGNFVTTLAAAIIVYEIELVLQTNGPFSEVQFFVIGKLADGNLNPSHRVLNSELTVRTVIT
ncbi:hypothetical protein [Paenibacillus hamazuiensis]|uniref:hypothetical protein n=1 Tax=Paenibacillus hamazuiensis TaxID=2936508 RepID=UPI00200E6A2A|nr:hypothetical protein [Paenibacillus hamazuiensis]